MGEAQRRATERVPFTDKMQFVSPRAMVGQGIDIGAGGVGVMLPEELEVGLQVEMEIFGGRATAYGTVRWVKPEQDGFRTGIQFREEDWAIMELIEVLRSQEG